MISLLRRYTDWLHLQWPSGRVEPGPMIGPNGTTALPGVYVAGDLTGVPLLKFAADSGARAVRTMLADPGFAKGRQPSLLDLAIIGGGVAGISAAIEAKRAGLSFAVFESSAPFDTLANFPKGKPIYTYPRDMQPEGAMRFEDTTKEALVAQLDAVRQQEGIETVKAHVTGLESQGGTLALHVEGSPPVRARRVLVAIGRSGNFRKLGVPGESLSHKVFNRLHDPAAYSGRRVLVVGGGDSALESAVSLARSGATVTLVHRGASFTRPKPENLAALEMARVEVRLGSQIAEIREDAVGVRASGGAVEWLPNDAVFTMLGREAPLGFFRRSGLPVAGDWPLRRILSLAGFLLFCLFLYNWKAGGWLNAVFRSNGWFPYNVPDALARMAGDPSTWLGTLAIAAGEPGFYYSLAYTLCVLGFGVQRIRRRKTPYVKAQTLTLIAVQLVPLFLLPYLLLPWMGHNGFFDSGFGRSFANALFPAADYGHGREYWRAFGFILAWPLFIWNVFRDQPLGAWLAISLVQTFVIIPLIVWRWGKGAYCGWICSCGALAETLGDAHRRKMPHGPFWNRLNLIGQAVLGAAVLLLLARAVAWLMPGTAIGTHLASFHHGLLSGWALDGVQLNYYHIVDMGMAGILGVGLYFHFSGRTWCRFACPLAALMHIYARFSRFRIFADKQKCISCNECTSVCHQGIDVMAFAVRGRPMEDPQCVRCSACVQSCPTGVLEFGRLDRRGDPVKDRLAARSL